MSAGAWRAAVRRVAVLGFVLAAALPSGAAWAASTSDDPRPAAPTPTAGRTTSAVDDFGACLAAQDEGDLVLLVDESGSLRRSDPDGARVTAASYLLSRLATSSARSGYSLDVAVAGFSADFAAVQDWTRLDAGNLSAILAALERFRNRSTGIDTDYWTALEGSRRALASRGAEAGRERCQAVVWFSDGRLEIEPRLTQAQRQAYPGPKPYAEDLDLTTAAGAAAATQAAEESLCRDGGLADQLRSSGIALFGVGLAGEGSRADFALMRSIAAGTDGSGTACGALVDPPPGEFYPASDIDGLLLAFDRITTPDQPPIVGEEGVCQGEVCPEGAHRFVLDASIRSVHVLATADASGLDVVLVTPAGEQVALAPRTVGAQQAAATDAVDVEYTWQSARSVEADLAEGDDPRSWTGVWSLVFVDRTGSTPDAVSRTNIHIDGDIFPAWLNQAEWAPPDGRVLHTGEVVAGVELGLVDGEEDVIDPASLLGTIAYTATVLPRGGAQSVVLDGASAPELAAPVGLDLRDVAPGAATLRLDLQVTTASATDSDGRQVPGTTLSPQRVDVPLTLAPPVDFPTVASRLDFGTVEGAVDVSAPLTVTGPGCVWLGDGDTLALAGYPQEAGSISVTSATATSAQTCLAVADGERAELPLDLVTEAPANGAVNGTLAVTIAPLDEPERATTVDVEVAADLRKPLNTRNALLALVAALLLGPGIPLALAYLVKYATAKIPPRALSAQQIPVTVTPGGQVLRDGMPFALRPSDLVHLVRLSPKGSRSVDADGLELATATGASPFGAGFVRVRAPGLVGASSAAPEPAGRRNEARLPLAVHNTWAVLHDPAGPQDAATVLLLVGADAGPHRAAELADDLRRRLPGIMPSLREAAPAASGGRPAGASPAQPGATAVDPDDPFGLGPTTASTTPSAPVGDPLAPGGATGDPFGPAAGDDPWSFPPPDDGRGRIDETDPPGGSRWT